MDDDFLEDDEEDEDELRREIVGVQAPTIDLESVGISRELAMILGPEGTREVIVGAMLRGVARVLHPDHSLDERASEKMAAINAIIDQIKLLEEEEWQETYRRFVSRRDSLLTRLNIAKESIANLNDELSERDEQMRNLQLANTSLRERLSSGVGVNSILSLFMSGVSRPEGWMEREGDNDMSVTNLLNCVIVTSGHVHYIGRPEFTNTDDHDVSVADEMAPSIQAAKYARASGDDRGVFAYDNKVRIPRKVLGCYRGKLLKEDRTSGGTMVPLDDCLDILSGIVPEIGIGSRLVIASPAISGGGQPAGIMFQMYTPVHAVYGPYNVTKARVTGPHIGGE